MVLYWPSLENDNQHLMGHLYSAHGVQHRSCRVLCARAMSRIRSSTKYNDWVSSPRMEVRLGARVFPMEIENLREYKSRGSYRGEGVSIKTTGFHLQQLSKRAGLHRGIIVVRGSCLERRGNVYLGGF